MRTARALIVTVALATSTLAMAIEPEPTATPSEHRLSPEQIEQVLTDAARKREASDRGNAPAAAPDEAPVAVRGEVGVSIGTGGYRSAFGTAHVDLPGNGAAILSVGSQRQSSDPYFYPPN